MSSTSTKARFSEAMWFKHGEQEEAAAQAPDTAAVELAAHTLPIEDRYQDDGSLSTREIARYSLRTGGTSQVPSLAEAPRRMEVSAREVLGLKSRAQVWMIAVGVIAAIAVAIAMSV